MVEMVDLPAFTLVNDHAIADVAAKMTLDSAQTPAAGTLIDKPNHEKTPAIKRYNVVLNV
jgi:hypothetical protein